MKDILQEDNHQHTSFRTHSVFHALIQFYKNGAQTCGENHLYKLNCQKSDYWQ